VRGEQQTNTTVTKTSIPARNACAYTSNSYFLLSSPVFSGFQFPCAQRRSSSSSPVFALTTLRIARMRWSYST
jgi:hypothetical protein